MKIPSFLCFSVIIARTSAAVKSTDVSECQFLSMVE